MIAYVKKEKNVQCQFNVAVCVVIIIDIFKTLSIFELFPFNFASRISEVSETKLENSTTLPQRNLLQRINIALNNINHLTIR